MYCYKWSWWTVAERSITIKSKVNNALFIAGFPPDLCVGKTWADLYFAVLISHSKHLKESIYYTVYKCIQWSSPRMSDRISQFLTESCHKSQMYNTLITINLHIYTETATFAYIFDWLDQRRVTYLIIWLTPE